VFRTLKDLQAAHTAFQKAALNDGVDLWAQGGLKVTEEWPESSYFTRLIELSMTMCQQGRKNLRKALNQFFDADNIGNFAFHNDLDMVLKSSHEKLKREMKNQEERNSLVIYRLTFLICVVDDVTDCI
jgi:hypothetical protein